MDAAQSALSSSSSSSSSPFAFFDEVVIPIEEDFMVYNDTNATTLLEAQADKKHRYELAFKIRSSDGSTEENDFRTSFESSQDWDVVAVDNKFIICYIQNTEDNFGESKPFLSIDKVEIKNSQVISNKSMQVVYENAFPPNHIQENFGLYHVSELPLGGLTPIPTKISPCGKYISCFLSHPLQQTHLVSGIQCVVNIETGNISAYGNGFDKMEFLSPGKCFFPDEHHGESEICTLHNTLDQFEKVISIQIRSYSDELVSWRARFLGCSEDKSMFAFLLSMKFHREEDEVSRQEFRLRIFECPSGKLYKDIDVSGPVDLYGLGWLWACFTITFSSTTFILASVACNKENYRETQIIFDSPGHTVDHGRTDQGGTDLFPSISSTSCSLPSYEHIRPSICSLVLTSFKVSPNGRYFHAFCDDRSEVIYELKRLYQKDGLYTLSAVEFLRYESSWLVPIERRCSCAALENTASIVQSHATKICFSKDSKQMIAVGWDRGQFIARTYSLTWVARRSFAMVLHCCFFTHGANKATNKLITREGKESSNETHADAIACSTAMIQVFGILSLCSNIVTYL